MERGTWKWQEEGTAWKGVGIYHVTLVVPSREALLGRLVIPESDPKQAVVERTEMGKEIVYLIGTIPQHHPQIRLIQYCLMPDHAHFILYVTESMSVSIKAVVRGFWQSAKQAGREYISSISPNDIRDNKRNNSNIKEGASIFPIFTEMPFIRPLSRKGQLQTMIRYVQMNPQRLATKRLMPGYFRVQRDIEIAGQKYSGIGNIGILQAEKFSPVHVRRIWVEDAEQHGDATRLREYMNGCVLAARKGTVMVSPFISPKEKEVLEVLLREKHTIIYIAENGFGEYYKPAEGLFEAVAEGRMLILSPWLHDPDKPHVTRAECVAMNKMAEEICAILGVKEKGETA